MAMTEVILYVVFIQPVRMFKKRMMNILRKRRMNEHNNSNRSVR